MKNIKEVFENDNIIITNITQGKNGRVRIDAKTRHYLAMQNYNKKISKFSCYKYQPVSFANSCGLYPDTLTGSGFTGTRVN